MNPAIKASWVAALRSGKYKQTSREIRNHYGHYCLGVLCDLHSKETGGEWKGRRYMESYGNPPAAVVDWLGTDFDFISRLASENDSGASFHEIADIIEKSEP